MPLTVQTEPSPLVADAKGTFRVGRTRVRLDTIVEAFREGLSAEEIAEQYPSVALADVYSTIAYYLRHTKVVEAYLEERAKAARNVRAENERRFPPSGLRERLLARRSA